MVLLVLLLHCTDDSTPYTENSLSRKFTPFNPHLPKALGLNEAYLLSFSSVLCSAA